VHVGIADTNLWETNCMGKHGHPWCCNLQGVDLGFEIESQSPFHITVHKIKLPFLDAYCAFQHVTILVT